MLYGSEVWPLKESDISRSYRANKQMVRRMCNVILRDKKSSAELRNRLGVVNIVDVLHQTRLKCFGQVERTKIENPVSNCRFIEVDNQRRRNRPCKAWTQVIKVI